MNSVDETEVRRIRFVVRKREDRRSFDMEDGFKKILFLRKKWR